MSISTKSADLAYYSFDKLFSYNGVYNFIVGARGLGKTYGAKRHVIRKAIRTGEQFIYLRRYKTELAGRGTFFADISHEFPEWDFRVDGPHAQMASVETRKAKKRDWQTIGYFAALSNAQTQKSVAYPLVKTIIFDEFIIDKGALRYLPNEAKAFNDFYSTVDRWKDKTRVLFLANALTITNPYFLEYDILPDDNKPEEWLMKANNFIVCHFADSAEFSTGVFKTRFGQFIKDSEYADFAVASQFADNHDRMLERKVSDARYFCTVETKQGIFSIWINYSTNTYYVQEKRPGVEIFYTTVPAWMDEHKKLLNYSDKLMQYFRSSFTNGRMFFDTARSRNAFIEVFRR
jgi:hypothetical protein